MAQVEKESHFSLFLFMFHKPNVTFVNVSNVSVQNMVVYVCNCHYRGGLLFKP